MSPPSSPSTSTSTATIAGCTTTPRKTTPPRPTSSPDGARYSGRQLLEQRDSYLGDNPYDKPARRGCPYRLAVELNASYLSLGLLEDIAETLWPSKPKAYYLTPRVRATSLKGDIEELRHLGDADGLQSQDLTYGIQQLDGEPPLQQKDWPEAIKTRIEKRELERTYITFDKLKSSTLSFLLETAMRDGRIGGITVNLASFAAILSLVYFMDDDDVHKANIGFYIRENELVFFKLDHDKMLYSDMAPSEKKGIRGVDVSRRQEKNPITPEAIRDFPRINYAYYTPSKSGIAGKDWSSDDAASVRRLAACPAFQAAADQAFFTLTKADTQDYFPLRKYQGRDDYTGLDSFHAQIHRAVKKRQAALQAAYEKLPNDRKVVVVPPVRRALSFHGSLPDDSSLGESGASAGELSSSHSVSSVSSIPTHVEQSALGGKTIEVQKRPLWQVLIQIDQGKYTLPNAKQAALTAFTDAINAAKTYDDVKDIYDTLKSNAARFVYELQSRLWIVRKFRGSHGLTSTAMTILALLSEKLERLPTRAKQGNQHAIASLQYTIHEELDVIKSAHMSFYQGVKRPEALSSKVHISSPWSGVIFCAP